MAEYVLLRNGEVCFVTTKVRIYPKWTGEWYISCVTPEGYEIHIEAYRTSPLEKAKTGCEWRQL